MKLGTSFVCLPFKNAPQIKRIIYALSRIISVFHHKKRCKEFPVAVLN